MAESIWCRGIVEPRASFSLSEKGDWSVSSEVPGQSIGYGMGFLRLSSYLSDAIARAEELLVHADTLDSFSSVLLSSLLWAGRATTEQNLEEAFLLYAIALETLMLPEGTQHELRFRLALRVACFLGDDYEERRHIVERIKNLYDIRSKIVHSGSFQVSKHEVMSMNSITKQAVLKALVDPRLRACKQRKDAAKWFEERVLGSK